MNFKKILTIGISESSISPKYWNKIDNLTEKRISLQKDSTNIKTELKDADCVLINPFVFTFEKNLIDDAPSLKYIGVLSTAFGNVDYNHATTKDITVCNIPNYSTEAVAEFAFGILLESLRDLERAKTQAKGSDYSEATFFNTSEIKGKKFGIIGLGNIGSRIAEIALVFGADIKYWSKNRKENLESKGVQYVSIEELVSECDIISLNLAFNKDTENILNAPLISKLKKDAILINLAPNELIDLNALEKRLSDKDITYIMDHSDELTAEQATKLSKHKNCIIYPPIGYTTKEATIEKQEIFVRNIEKFLQGSPTNKVN